MAYDYLIEKKDWNSTEENLIHSLGDTERAYFAKRIKYYDGILIDLSVDKSDEVRIGAANNPITPVKVLKRMAQDDVCIEVRMAAEATLKELKI